MRLERIEWDGADAAALAARVRDAGAGRSRRSPRRSREIIARVREPAATRRCASSPSAFGETPPRAPAGRPGADRGGARRCSTAELREALRVAAAQHRRRRPGRARALDRAGDGRARRRASGSRSRAAPVASAGVYAPGGRAAYPSSVLMGVPPGAGRGRLAARRRHAARRRRAARPTRCSPPARSPGSRRSTRSAARRRSPRSPTGPRRSPRST